MANKSQDKYTELNGLLQEKQAVKLAAMSKISAAKAEAEAKLAEALRGKKDSIEDFDADAFIAGSEELSHLPEYIRKLDSKYYQLRDQPFGASDDTFMAKVKQLSAEATADYEKEIRSELAKLLAITKEYLNLNNRIGDLENGWLCTRFKTFTNNSVYTEYVNDLMLNLYNNNMGIDGFNPYE